MRRSWNAIGLAGLLMLVSSSTGANESIFKAYYLSPDAISCKHWKQVRGQGGVAAESAESWVYGFASAINLFWDQHGGVGVSALQRDASV